MILTMKLIIRVFNIFLVSCFLFSTLKSTASPPPPSTEAERRKAELRELKNEFKTLKVTNGHLSLDNEKELTNEKLQLLFEKLKILKVKIDQITIKNSKSLTQIPKNIIQFKGLFSIEFSNCGIADIPNELGTLDGLTMLDLSGNALTSVPSSVFGDLSLARLNLSSNPIKDSPDSVSALLEVLCPDPLSPTDDSLPFLLRPYLNISNLKITIPQKLITQCMKNWETFRYSGNNPIRDTGSYTPKPEDLDFTTDLLAGAATATSACHTGIDPRAIFYHKSLKQIISDIKKIKEYLDKSPSDENSDLDRKRLAAYLILAEKQKKAAYEKLSYPGRATGEVLMGKTVPERSHENLENLKTELGDLSSEEKMLRQHILGLNYSLKHNTNHSDVIKSPEGQSQILSNDELHRRGIAFEDSSGAEGGLGNRDFVFFRLGTDNQAEHNSRYGKDTIVMKPDQLYSSGWVYFHDLIQQDSSEFTDSLQFKGKKRTLRTEPDGPDIVSIATYSAPSGESTESTYKLSDKFFHGRDIIPGLAYSLIKEFRGFGPELSQTIARSRNPDCVIKKLIPRFYRIQALIPNRAILSQEQTLAIHEGEERDDFSDQGEKKARTFKIEEIIQSCQ